MKVKPRYIEVRRCAVGECPYCVPDSFRGAVNFCHAYEYPQEVSATLKGFPQACPLEKTDE